MDQPVTNGGRRSQHVPGISSFTTSRSLDFRDGNGGMAERGDQPGQEAGGDSSEKPTICNGAGLTDPQHSLDDGSTSKANPIIESKRCCMCNLGDISGVVTAAAAALMAWIARAALHEARLQINASKRSQKEATAANIYGEYLRLAIDHPDESRRDKQNDKIRVDDPKYDAFVTYALYAAEEILSLFPDDINWRNALKLDLSHHKDFFNSDAYKNDVNSYTTELQGIVKEIRSE